MTPEQFVYWLQGYAEVSDEVGISAEQWQIIKDHLKEVFHKKTPDRALGDLGSMVPPLPPYIQQTVPMPPFPNQQHQIIC